MPLGTLRQQLIFPQYEDGQNVVESDVDLRKLAAAARLHSAPPSVFVVLLRLKAHFGYGLIPDLVFRIYNASPEQT